MPTAPSDALITEYDVISAISQGGLPDYSNNTFCP